MGRRADVDCRAVQLEFEYIFKQVQLSARFPNLVRNLYSKCRHVSQSHNLAPAVSPVLTESRRVMEGFVTLPQQSDIAKGR